MGPLDLHPSVGGGDWRNAPPRAENIAAVSIGWCESICSFHAQKQTFGGWWGRKGEKKCSTIINLIQSQGEKAWNCCRTPRMWMEFIKWMKENQTFGFYIPPKWRNVPTSSKLESKMQFEYQQIEFNPPGRSGLSHRSNGKVFFCWPAKDKPAEEASVLRSNQQWERTFHHGDLLLSRMISRTFSYPSPLSLLSVTDGANRDLPRF